MEKQMISKAQIKRIWVIAGKTGTLKKMREHLVLAGLQSLKELSEEQASVLIEKLSAEEKVMDKKRKRIFSAVRSIKLISQESKLSEYEVLDYLRRLKGLGVPLKNRLNDYNTEELSKILRKLDVIRPKTQAKYRKNLKAIFHS